MKLIRNDYVSMEVQYDNDVERAFLLGAFSTTLYDFDSKWKDMLPEGTAIPTAPLDFNVWKKGGNMNDYVGVYEGAGYQSKGVYRPFMDCRMHTNGAGSFCPVCQRAISRLIEFYTE